MKMKRFLFIMILIAIFVSCFYRMNEHYDQFSRYPYPLNESKKAWLLKNLDKDEINYMIENKLEYNVVNTFMDIEGFNIKNSLCYEKCLNASLEDKTYIVAFVNKYKNKLNYDDLDLLLNHYSYNEIMVFYDQEANQSLKLVADPTALLLTLKEDENLFHYVPANLKKLSKIKTMNIDGSSRMYLQKDALTALKTMLDKAIEINQKAQGGLVVYCTYLSYEQQTLLTSQNHPMIKQAGFNEYQLGYSVCLTTDTTLEFEEDSLENNFKYLQELQYSWLKDNAYKYGFIFRNKEELSMNDQLYFELRYVGEEIALTMHQQQITLEEYKALP